MWLCAGKDIDVKDVDVTSFLKLGPSRTQSRWSSAVRPGSQVPAQQHARSSAFMSRGLIPAQPIAVCNADDLPDEVLGEILSQLSLARLVQLSVSSSRMYRLVQKTDKVMKMLDLQQVWQPYVTLMACCYSTSIEFIFASALLQELMHQALCSIEQQRKQ
eukprot:jgi/Chrzof1/8575/Cz03g16030.t1